MPAVYQIPTIKFLCGSALSLFLSLERRSKDKENSGRTWIF